MVDTPKKHSILTESTVEEVILVHPSALNNVKKDVSKQLKQKLGQWDPVRQGVLVDFKGRKQIKNNGRGKVVDTSPFVHLVVKYTGVYAKPVIGARLFGQVQAVSVQNGAEGEQKVTLVCQIEA